MDNQECEVCGCKEFAIDAGFYYCQECGTRAKEIQEIQYELTQDFSTVRLHTRKIKKSTSAKSKDYKLTTWETYNYILIGLVEELQKLGASESFKLTTLQLWTAYLSNIEVAFTSKTQPLIPKLPVTFKKNDAEILYGRIRTKRKRKSNTHDTSSVSLDHTSLDASLASKQRRNDKRALIEAEYEAIASTQQSDSASLFNTSMHTVQTSSSTKTEGTIQYNTPARKECLKHMNRKHYNKHKKHESVEMNCHKRPSRKYLQSATFVTRNCLWSILYLALNLTEDSIQLGDMIRYCREGSISYYNLKHFLPEEYVNDDKTNEILDNAKYKVPSHHQIRVVAFKIAKIIKVTSLKRPNLFVLSERYCRELELPQFVAESVEKLSFVNVNEVQEVLNETSLIPNYEGRTMAYIIFVLKLIFGLDDRTEHDISEKINILNSELSKVDDKHMPIFSWMEWIRFIEYRKLLIMREHFPTKLLLDPNGPKSGHMYQEFWKRIKFFDDTDDAKMPQLMHIMKKVFTDLTKLQNKQSSNNFKVMQFDPTLTPFRDYFRAIVDNCDGYKIPNDLVCEHSIHDMSFYINGNTCNIDLLDKILVVKFKNESLNKDLYIIDNEKVLKNEKDDSMQRVKRREIVQIKPVGFMEWRTKLEENSKSNNAEKIREAKRKSITLKKELNSVKVLKNEAIREINKVESAKFGGSVNMQDFVNVMVDKVKDPSFTLKSSSKYKSRVSKSLTPSPRRNLRGKFLDANSTDQQIMDIKNKRGHKKWFVSSFYENPVLGNNNLKLHQQILPDIVKKKESDVSENVSATIEIPRPAAQYWINHFGNVNVTNALFEKVENRFPNSFSWLLEECARTLEMSKLDLYKELVEIETQFGLKQFPDRNRDVVNEKT